MQRIKKGDDVIVTAGRDKGKRGNVLRVLDDERALVDNVNLVKKHKRGNPNTGETGGIMEQEAPIHLSNLVLYNPTTKKGERIGYKRLEDGRKVRYFKSNGEVIDLA
ncbi:MAG: 50S ribosomal protein L24 [Gammaproteobacteria bacterium]|nr:50S ribosomal protein L24 [Gammaproteobacteria bacterium]MDE0280495.1 50S ribosomal protein L24 [Gammaproteobacteria bacterium]MDE0715401.1 50S ribosomal protein L24 [Gammaproteobacteria bacterium]MXX16994.1 50S ribosomal protein L24 [Gammaproteobacteria bacterium]MXY66681.1 50S ribosomal protein L24 [Gammaproteobacteria bacterium]